MPHDDVDASRQPRPAAWLSIIAVFFLAGVGIALFLAAASQSYLAHSRQLEAQLDAALQDRDLDAQVYLYDRLLNRHPGNADYLASRARLAARHGSPEQLEAWLEKWEDAAGSPPAEDDYLRAVSSLRHNRPEDALQTVEAYLVQEDLSRPDRIAALEVKTQAATAAGDLELAETAASELILSDPSVENYATRAEIHARQANFDGAVEDLETAAARAGNSRRKSLNKRKAELQRINMWEHKQPSVRMHVTRMVKELDREFPDFEKEYRPAMQVFAAGHYREAKDRLDQLARKYPDSTAMKLPLAAVRYKLDYRADIPFQELPHAYRSNDVAEKLWKQGRDLFYWVHMEQKFGPDEYPFQRKLLQGQFQYRYGLYEKALATAEDLLASLPESPGFDYEGQVTFIEVESLRKMGRRDEAMDRLMRSAKSDAATEKMVLEITNHRHSSRQQVESDLRMINLALERLPQSQKLKEGRALLQNRLRTWKQN